MSNRKSLARPTSSIEGLEARTLYSFVPAAGVAPVVDNDGNSYVLGSDDLRMMVARYTPGGESDTKWVENGIYDLNVFTSEDAADTPRAITIDRERHMLYVAGSSSGQWAVARVNIDYARTTSAWRAHFLDGTADALWLDSSTDNTRLGVAGTSAAGETQVAVLYGFDTPGGPGEPFHSGGTFDESFGGGAGYATAPAPALAAPAGSAVTKSASALIDLDNLPLIKPAPAQDEWIVQRATTYAGPGGTTLTRKSVIGFRPDGTISPRFANNRGVALFTLWGNRPIGARNAPAPLQSSGGATLNLAHSTELW